MSCLSIGLWILGGTVSLLLWPVFGKLFGDTFIKAFWEDALSNWWERKFPPREEPRAKGFDVVQRKPDAEREDEQPK